MIGTSEKGDLMFKRAISGAILIAALIPVYGGAYTFNDAFFGEEVMTLSARSLALGGSGVTSERSVFSLRTNPALLAQIEHGRFDLSWGVTKADDNWAFPIHDSFDGFLTYNIYALNANAYDDYAFGVAFNFDLGRRIALGFAWGPLYDFRYDYVEEVRDRDPFADITDLLIGQNAVEAEGRIYAYSLGLAKDLLPWLSVGAAYHFIEGDSRHRSTVEFVDESRNDLVSSLDRDEFTGGNITLGMALELPARLDLGLAYTTEAELETHFARWRTEGGSILALESGDLKLTYPWSLSAGVAYRPRRDLPTTMNVEMNLTNWSDFDFDPWDNTTIWSFEDVVEFRGGVEHRFYNDLTVRFGFRYLPSYLDNDIAQSMVTFGTGFKVSDIQIDLAGQVGTREYRHGDIFAESLYSDDTSDDRSYQDRVKESILRGLLTVSYGF